MLHQATAAIRNRRPSRSIRIRVHRATRLTDILTKRRFNSTIFLAAGHDSGCFIGTQVRQYRGRAVEPPGLHPTATRIQRHHESLRCGREGLFLPVSVQVSDGQVARIFCAGIRFPGPKFAL